jgi:hypothetical protein
VSPRRKKTKTEELFDKLTTGKIVYVIIEPWQIKKKYADNTTIPVLLKTKVKRTQFSNFYEKAIHIQVDVQKDRTDQVFFRDALNNIFFDREKAIAKYQNTLKKHKDHASKIMKSIQEKEDAGFVLNEKTGEKK